MMVIRTPRLIIRNWEERDRDLFFRINSDEQVMEFFGFRRDRTEADALFDRLRSEIDDKGYGFAAVEITATGECVGFVGVRKTTDLEPLLPAGTVEIGWRLAPEFWGKGYVTEAAEALLAFAFEKLRLDEIVSFAVWNNHRSTAVMERIGMRRDSSGDFDHPSVPDSHPHLKQHVLYRLRRQDWEQQKGRPDPSRP
jgi:RimJ/RimL family protein N-acetyltransferase